MKTRVIVTGMGTVTPIGNDVESFWQGSKDKTAGIGPITYFDTAEYKCKLTAEVKGSDPKQYIDTKVAYRMETFSQFAAAVSKGVLEQSGINMEKKDPYRVGVYVGSNIGSLQAMEKDVKKLNDKGLSRVNPLLVPPMINNMVAGNTVIQFGSKGKCFNVATACATGTHSIGGASRSTQYGKAGVMMAGEAEVSTTSIGTAGFTFPTALNTTEDVPRAPIPSDEDRNGFVMDGGTDVIALESLEHVKARGANALAGVVGYGTTYDAFRITSPAEDGNGVARAIENAMKDVGTMAEDIDYVNTHGTSTHHNDLFKTKAIKLALGDHAQKAKINSTKSMIGHLLGAAGGMEFITCAKSIQDGFVRVITRLKKPGEGCDLDYTVGDGVSIDVDVIISNSLGLDGYNASLIVKKSSEWQEVMSYERR